MDIVFKFPGLQPNPRSFLFSATCTEEEHTYIMKTRLPIMCTFDNIATAVTRCVQTLFKMRMQQAVDTLWNP
jgi:hypothetical protein